MSVSKARLGRDADLRHHAHYVIEGERFLTIADVARAARRRGFDGTDQVMQERLGGPLTWAHLARPVDHRRSQGRAVARQHSRDEGLEAARRVDERRAAIAAASHETIEED